MKILWACLLGAAATCAVPSPSFGQASASPIDRRALVTRHNPPLTRVDPASPLMVGNGNLGFTADITGLQTFQEQYSPRVPLLIQAQWAWHSFSNPAGFSLAQAEQPVDVRGQPRAYLYLRNWDEARQPHIQWLRANPHRFSLAVERRAAVGVGLMAGGWDGAFQTGQGARPGFPNDGRWVVRSEGLRPLP